MTVTEQLQGLDALVIEHTKPPITPILRNKLALVIEQCEAHVATSAKQDETLARQVETIERLVEENQRVVAEYQRLASEHQKMISGKPAPPAGEELQVLRVLATKDEYWSPQKVSETTGIEVVRVHSLLAKLKIGGHALANMSGFHISLTGRAAIH